MGWRNTAGRRRLGWAAAVVASVLHLAGSAAALAQGSPGSAGPGPQIFAMNLWVLDNGSTYLNDAQYRCDRLPGTQVCDRPGAEATTAFLERQVMPAADLIALARREFGLPATGTVVLSLQAHAESRPLQPGRMAALVYDGTGLVAAPQSRPARAETLVALRRAAVGLAPVVAFTSGETLALTLHAYHLPRVRWSGNVLQPWDMTIKFDSVRQWYPWASFDCALLALAECGGIVERDQYFGRVFPRIRLYRGVTTALDLSDGTTLAVRSQALLLPGRVETAYLGALVLAEDTATVLEVSETAFAPAWSAAITAGIAEMYRAAGRQPLQSTDQTMVLQMLAGATGP